LEALNQIHLYQSETFPLRRVWIDAICIDQKNDGEKAVQVRHMDKIYSDAQVVLVWLGSAQNHSDMAMDHASELQEKLRSIGGVNYFDNLPSHGLEDQTHPLWPSFGHLLRRSWFELLWVIQEAVLANKLVVLCGSKWLDWEILSGLTMALHQTGLLHLALKDHEAQLNRDDGFFTIPSINISRLKMAANGSLLFGPLLSSSRSKQCTEPVDCIWAILGLAHPQARDDRPSWVKIDYSTEGKRCFWEPYISFAKWHLQDNDPYLMLLSEASSREKPEEMP
jgi:Heterokaryon incompatibility protein (HET)